MGLHERTDDREPETGRGGGAIPCGIGLVEPVEDVGQVRRGDPAARVHHGDRDLAAGLASRIQPDTAGGGRVADRIVGERQDDLPDPVRIGVHGQPVGRARGDRHPRPGRARLEVPRDGRQQRRHLDRAAVERQRSGLGEAHRPEVVHDPRQQPRLVAHGLQVPVLVRVHAVEHRRGGRLDDGERRLELVRGVLEQPPARVLRGLEVRRHRIERPSERPDLVAAVPEPRPGGQVPTGDGRGGRLQPGERANRARGDPEPEQRRGTDGECRHDHEGDDRLLLDLLQVLAGHRAAALAAALSGRGALRLHPREPAPHDRRRRDRDRDRGQQGDQRERGGEARTQRHDRAPR